MADESLQTSQTPPSGDHKKAEDYLQKLVPLIKTEKLEVFSTDLSQHDPSSLQTHYRIDLSEYRIEISHSKQPDTGKDSYVMLFNNLKMVQEGSCEKVILAYLHLTEDQFSKFKSAADYQIEQRRIIEEQKRFQSAVAPLDQELEKLISGDDTDKMTEENDKLLKDDVTYTANQAENPTTQPQPSPFATV